MSRTFSVPVNQLKLDLANFRTVPQADEAQAVNAMIAIRADYFWALMESLIDDGYLPTDNIIVLETDATPPEMIVKEGNRRIAALKMIHGHMPLPGNGSDIPNHIAAKLKKLSAEWRAANIQVPCAVFERKDARVVDRIVTLAHGKGEKAGRDQWNAVARARHNRDEKKLSEPGLDLLEKYLKTGQNLTALQKERWAGDYPLTVLDEAIKRLPIRLGANSASDLVKRYPSISYRDSLENILRDIGLEGIGFKHIRSPGNDFAVNYGTPQVTPSNNSDDGALQRDSNEPTDKSSDGTTAVQTQGATDSVNAVQNLQDTASGNKNTNNDTQQPIKFKGNEKVTSVAINDPRAVKRELKKFKPRGSNRQKVVTLRDEALKLNLKDNPIAFCFLLRSMFEISAKAYCKDHEASSGLSSTKPNGQDKNLADLLKDITIHMTTLPNQKKDTAKLKVLHGAMTEMAKSESILSVTSMNNLVHNPKFTITEGDISTMFGNIFPLLEEMNA